MAMPNDEDPRSSTRVWTSTLNATIGVVVVGPTAPHETRGHDDTVDNAEDIALTSSALSMSSTDVVKDAANRLFDTVIRSSGDAGVYYPYPSGYGWTHIVCASIAVTLIMLVIVLGNALVVAAVAVDRNLKGLQNWFIASLAVSDLLVGLFIMPLSLANELMGYWAFGSVLCQLWLAVDVMLCTASILNLCLISLDRYWSIVRAIAYLRQRTPRRAALMIGSVWILSAVICFPPLAGWSRPQPVVDGRPNCVLSEEPGYVVYSIVGSFYLPLGVMIAVYVKIYRAARWRARRLLASENKSSTSYVMTAEGVKKSMKIGANDNEERCRSRQRPLQPTVEATQSAGFLSPCKHDEQQRSVSSMDVDSELVDDQRHFEKIELVRNKSELELANEEDAIVTAQSEENSNELTSILITTRKFLKEKTPEVVVVHPNCQPSLTRTITVEKSSTKSASVVQRSDDVRYDVDLSTGRDQRDDEIGMTPYRRSDPDVVVIVPSTTEPTRPTMTSLMKQTVTSSSRPRVSSLRAATDATQSTSDSEDEKKINTSTKSRCFLTASGETKWLAAANASTTPDYRSTRARRNVTRSGCEIIADEQRPQKRRLRASWTSSGVIHRFRSASSSGRRYAKAVGLFAETERAKRKAARARERRATIVLGIVMVSFIGCWLPFFAVYPVALLTGTKVPGPLFGVIFWLGYCNSALNPIIYTVFNRDFRRAFQKIITERIARCKSSSSSWS